MSRIIESLDAYRKKASVKKKAPAKESPLKGKDKNHMNLKADLKRKGEFSYGYGIDLISTGKGSARWQFKSESAEARALKPNTQKPKWPVRAVWEHKSDKDRAADIADARELGVKMAERLRAGLDPALVVAHHRQATKEGATVDELMAVVLEKETKARKWSPGTVRQYLNAYTQHIKPVLGHLSVRSLTKEHTWSVLGVVADDSCLKAVSPQGFNKTKINLRRLFEYAEEQKLVESADALIGPSVLRRYAAVKPNTKRKPRPALPWRQVPAYYKFIDRVPSAYVPALKFKILTVLRTHEVLDLKWAQIQWDKQAIALKDETKTGHNNLVALAPPVLDLLQEQFERTGHHERVFPPVFDPTNEAHNRPLGYVMEEAHKLKMAEDGIGWVAHDGRRAVPHGFRTTRSAALLVAGWPSGLTDAMLGHANSSEHGRADVSESFEHYSDMIEFAPERAQAARDWANFVVNGIPLPKYQPNTEAEDVH